MADVMLSEFRRMQAFYIELVSKEPVELCSRGVRRSAVLVSPSFFDDAVRALGDEGTRYRFGSRPDGSSRDAFDEMWRFLEGR